MTRYLDSVPEPWTRAVIQDAIFKNFSNAKASIDDTPGGIVWRALHELDDSIWIFDTSTTELLDEICLFAERSKNPKFWHQVHTNEAEAHTRAVKRKLFNFTSSLMALVDHARNFQRETPVTGYADRLKEDFPTRGVHDFLQCLRNYNTHWRIAQAHWTIRFDFESRSRDARFRVTKAELLAWSGWKSKARQFLNDISTHAIDIYDLVSAYRNQVQSFYAWHKGAVIDQHAPLIRSYLEYKRLYEGIQKKCNWNLLLTHATKGLNPYQYLSRYLSHDQVEQLLTHEHRSEKQADALIRMLDMEEFCDADLRQKVLAVFRA